MDIDWDKLVNGDGQREYAPDATFESLSDNHQQGIIALIGLFRQYVGAGATLQEAEHLLAAMVRANRP